ncbi:unnamed protein product [Dracunculus medinensis]|uniref:Zf-Sec23_Sec24 domain-containing protein n=1 Tax=Dracunculus medinensis TaxID=318479 RepID=A0A0N4UN01_DRAME|nr:unnamed protein product [Dracunculus medinensis]
MRSSLYIAPATSDILKHSQIPFVVAISPFAPLHPNEYRLPVIDCGEIGPIRCHRCKAYMCPFMEFQDGGRRFRCSFCLTSTEGRLNILIVFLICDKYTVISISKQARHKQS